MSRFFTERYATLTPYTPGEQPRDQQYVKLNTNESPFPPSEGVLRAAAEEAGRLQLYSDPECTDLRNKLAEHFGLKPGQIIVTNGSDEILNFAFMAFGDESHPFAFPDITYGFYPVFAELNHIPYTEIPLQEDFTIRTEDYLGIGKNIVIANPNAPTGLFLPLGEIERILQSNPDRVVIVDEAYVNFGCESAVPLLNKYENLLVVQTYSKYRSMAGARLGFGLGSEALMADLNTLRYSTNPYNVNRVTAAAGVAALEEDAYYRANSREIIRNREWTTEQLQALGFRVLPSGANFIFAASGKISGEALYRKLKQRGILIRHFTKERICEFNRITIGTRRQMELLVEQIQEILKERDR